MNTNSVRGRIQEKLDAVTRRWWLYPLLLLLFFIRPYASEGYDPRESIDVMLQVFSNPLMYTFPALMPIAKAVPAVLIAGVMVLGNRMRRVFNGYVALLSVALACIHNTAPSHLSLSSIRHES